MKQLLFPILFLLLLSSALALDVPQPSGYVNDLAGMFSPEERASLESQLSAIEQNTTMEIAVLTIPSLEQESLEDYANRVFREWGIGKADVDNGILILVVRDEQKLRIEVGYGLEPTITDTMSGLIIRNRIAPAFREGQYASGISLAVQDVVAIANEDPLIGQQYAQVSLKPYQVSLVLLFAALYLAMIIYAAVKIRQQRKKWSWKLGWFAGIIILAFLFGAVVGWLTMFACIMLLSFSTSGPMLFLGGPGGRGGGGFGGGGFGGFGGGSSGGGGASGGW